MYAKKLMISPHICRMDVKSELVAEICVLVSAGTELTLFLVAGTVLWFGFSVRMMLITL